MPGAAHLPVEGHVPHELVELPQRPLLERPILITFLPKLSTLGCLFQCQLQKHHQVWLGEANVRLFTPVQGKVLQHRVM